MVATVADTVVDFWQDFSRTVDGLLVIDGSDDALDPDLAFMRSGALTDFDTIIVEGTETPNGHALALAIGAATQASILIEGNSATLRLPPPLPEPEPIAEPPRPERLSPDFPIERPASPANDYAKRIVNARRWPMPSEPISVVVPVYNRRLMLERTLHCLTHQTYPLELIEVVVADDGSSDSPDEVLEMFRGVFGGVRFVRQEDVGYRLSEVRNLGIDAATHGFVILLDCDMAPVPRLVELFARHLIAEPEGIYCGHRRYVDANEISPDSVRKSIEPMLALSDIRPNNDMVTESDEDGPTLDWRLPLYQATDGLRHEKHPFLAVCGGNIGFTKEVFASIGPFDVDFTAWGGEDAEWGYRAWNRGIYIVPILDACGMHQEPPGGRNETDRAAGRKETLPLLVDRCPVRFRTNTTSSGHSVPLVSIYIPAYNAETTIVDSIKSALRQSVTDLEVCVIDDGSTDRTAELVESHFGNNQRVRLLRQANGGIGAASNAAVGMCRAPFIGQLDADDLLKKHAVRRMLRALRSDTRVGVAYSSSELIDGDGNRIGDSFEFPYFSRSEMLYGMIVHHFRLFRARDWHRTSGFAADLENAVDYDMYLKLSEVTEIVHIPIQTYRYRKHPHSTSQSRNRTQRTNHRLALGRAMVRRGLAEKWQLLQVDPTDPRAVDFVPIGSRTSHYGPPIDTVRIRVESAVEDDQVAHLVKEMFPEWRRRSLPSGSARYRMVSPHISHARAVRCVERLQNRLPNTTVELMY